MSIETPRPLVVGFDGMHRVGKGTQAAMLADYIGLNGGRTITLRGDGTREGRGETPGDPLSPEWQERSTRLKSFDRTVASWNLASFILLKELNEVIHSPEVPDVVIVDRTVVSRASFLLHRGVLQYGQRTTLEKLYPDFGGEFSIEDTIPSIIFDMQVGSSYTLLDRLDPADPKYEFRAENIRGGFKDARVASLHLPANIENRVEKIDAGHSAEVIHSYIVKLLGHRALIADY